MLPIPLILTMYILSHLAVPLLAAYLFVVFAPAAEARTLHRWGGLPHMHTHTHPHAHLHHAEIKAVAVWPESRNHLVEVPEGPAEEADWSKWRSEQRTQQDVRRKLGCRSVDFGSCDVQKVRRAVSKVLESGAVDVLAEEHGGQGDEFVGVRLPRSLQHFLASTKGMDSAA